MSDLKERVKNIKDIISITALKCGRDPKDIKLVAVSKTVPYEKIIEGTEVGLEFFGESYIQEAQAKIKAICNLNNPLSWHFIGHLQSNKAKYAVKLFDLIHSVDSLKLAEVINKEAQKINKIQKILIEVNIGKEITKSGIDYDELFALLKNISQFKFLSIKGLMAIPPFFDEVENIRPYFEKLSSIFNDIKKQKIPNIDIKELSMGMSSDFEIAIEYGSTILRIGTAIFGERTF